MTLQRDDSTPNTCRATEIIHESPNCGHLTRSRRIARYLMQYKWYFPERNNPNVCLDLAWRHFERVTLPRYFTDDLAKNTPGFDRASMGETSRDTSLYPVYGTPLEELSDFSLGAGMYFAICKAVIYIMVVGGLINVYAFWYYQSSKYDEGNEKSEYKLLLGSAMCEDTTFVPCPGCKEEDWKDDGTRYEEDEDNKELVYVLKNMCDEVSLAMGFCSLASMTFVTMAVYCLGKYIEKVEIRFDESELTTQDYSLCVTNPPKHISDPNLYKEYFEKISGSHVVLVTIALKNYELLRALVRRRKNLQSLNDLMQLRNVIGRPSKRMSRESMSKDLNFVRIGKINWSRSFSEEDVKRARDYDAQLEASIIEKVRSNEHEIRSLYKKTFDVSKVFVVFETEAGQRTALNTLTKLHYEHELESHGIRNIAELKEEMKFHDVQLSVEEPAEPAAIRYEDFGIPHKTRITMKAITLFTTIGVMIGIVIVVRFLQGENAFYSSIFLSLCNSIVPEFIKVLSSIEAHDTNSDWQKTFYLKSTVIRWTNTAIIFYVITPFTKTLSSSTSEGSLLPSIMSIFFTEAVTSPTVALLDIGSNIKKHFIAPRCKTQMGMNLQFKGTPFSLAERFTDITKVVFITCFYSVIFPAGYFLGAMSLFMYYWRDKFLIMRSWQPAPGLGSEMAQMTKVYFYICIIFLSIMSSYWLSGFPFDNLCLCDDNPEGLGCNTTKEYPEKNEANYNTTNIYYYCKQDLLRSSFAFPVSTSKDLNWMTKEQKILVDVFGWLSLCVVCILAYVIMGSTIIEFFTKKKKSTYDPEATKDQYIDFSCNEEIFGYVPQVDVEGLQFPLLACDIDDIDSNLIYWEDDENGFDFWNIIYDVSGYRGQKRSIFGDCDESDEESNVNDRYDHKKESSLGPVFSTVTHYPPWN